MRKQKNFLFVCVAVFFLIMACFGTVAAQGTEKLRDRIIDPTLLNPPVEEPVHEEEKEVYDYSTGKGVTMIGDSIMSGNRDLIYDQLPDALIDAKGSRDVCGGFEAARRLQQEGKLTDVVIVELGTNGPLLKHEPYASGTQNLLELLGTERQILWVTVYCSYSQWMKMNNEYIWELSMTRPNIKVIDWYSLAVNHPEWFPDGVHPNLEGARHFAKLLRDSLAEMSTTKKSEEPAL